MVLHATLISLCSLAILVKVCDANGRLCTIATTVTNDPSHTPQHYCYAHRLIFFEAICVTRRERCWRSRSPCLRSGSACPRHGPPRRRTCGRRHQCPECSWRSTRHGSHSSGAGRRQRPPRLRRGRLRRRPLPSRARLPRHLLCPVRRLHAQVNGFGPGSIAMFSADEEPDPGR